MNLIQLVSEDGITLKKVASTDGGEYKGPCPFCGGTDRFTVHPKKGNGGRYICRQCGKYGDCIQYLRDLKGMTYYQACSALNITPDFKSNPSKAQSKTLEKSLPKELEEPCDRWRATALSHHVIRFKYLRDIEEVEHIRSWLKESRGLNDETLKKARLGWNWKEFFYDRESWGLEAELNANGNYKTVWLPEGLVIPHFNKQNHIIRLRIRRSDKSAKNRYILVSGSNTEPMILGSNYKHIIILESELDAWLISQEAGDLVCVVAMGSAQARPDVMTHEIFNNAERILLSLDADPAGAKECWNWWMDRYGSAMRYPVPIGKDIGEAYQEGLDIRTWIKVGLSSKQYSESAVQNLSDILKSESGHYSCTVGSTSLESQEFGPKKDKETIFGPNCENCPACSKDTMRCYYDAYFLAKPGKGITCELAVSNCPLIERTKL
jgi:DNA primase